MNAKARSRIVTAALNALTDRQIPRRGGDFVNLLHFFYYRNKIIWGKDFVFPEEAHKKTTLYSVV